MNTVEELKAQLAIAEKEARKADELARKAQQEKWQELCKVSDNWEWLVVENEYTKFITQEKIKGASVNKRMKPEILKAWKAGGYSTFSSDMQEEDRWFGMFYYRTDENILTHDGGGHSVLATPKLCNDAEWEQILSGDIPEKFKR